MRKFVPNNPKSIRPPVIIGFVVVLSLVGISEIVETIGLQTMAEFTVSIHKHPFEVSNAALRASVGVVKIERTMNTLVRESEKSHVERAVGLVEQGDRQLLRYLDLIRDRILGDPGRRLEQDTRRIFTDWRRARSKMIALVRDGQKVVAADVAIGEGATVTRKLQKKLLELTDYSRRKADSFIASASTLRRRHEMIHLLTAALILIIGVASIIFTLRRISKVEAMARKDHALLLSVVEGTDDPIFVKNAGSRYLLANSAAARLFHRPAAEVVGLSDDDLFPGEAGRRVRANDERIMSSAEPETVEETVEIDGVVRTFSTRKTPVLLKGGAAALVCISRDITEQAKAEAALAESELRLRSFIDSAPFGFTLWDSQLNLREANAIAMKDYLSPGVGETDPIGKNITEVIPDVERIGRYELYKQVVATGEPVSLDEVVVHPNFGERNISLKAFPAGNGMGLIHMDVTERKQSEDDLRQSEERLRTIIETTQEGFAEMDRNRRLIAVNPRMAQMFGYSPDEMIGLFVTENLVAAEDRDQLVKRLERRARGESEVFEQRYVRKDGQPVWAIVSATAVKDKEGRVTGAFALFTDITERKKTEMELRAVSGLLEKSQKLANIGSWGWTVATGELKWSDEVYRIFDLDAQNTAPSFEKFVSMIHADDRAAIVSAIENSVKHGVAFDVAYRICRLGGDVRHVAVTGGTERDAFGNATTMFGVIRDTSEEKRVAAERSQLEQRLHQTQKIEGIGQLAGGIAHDFNNVLQGILGYTDLAMNGLTEGSEALRYLQRVLASGRRGAELVQKILPFSQPSHRAVVSIRLQDVIEESMKLLRPSIPTTIEIRRDVDNECRPILADGTEVQQVVVNLCANANHAMGGRSGTLTLGLQEVQLKEEPLQGGADLKPGPYARLTVRDTGDGMDQLTLSRIFEPFFTTKDRGVGTGLGLSTAFGIVRSLGGGFKVHSTLGEGTAFEVYFPLDASEGAVADITERPATGDAVKGDACILFVDDEDVIVDQAKMGLERLGYHVEGHVSSEAALASFRRAPDRFDAVISDQTMPGLTGVELTQRLMEIRADIPIILCTGYSEVLNEAQAKELGIRAYVRKPVLARELAAVVRRVLGTKEVETARDV